LAEQKSIEQLQHFIEQHPNDTERVQTLIETLKKKYAKAAAQKEVHPLKESSEQAETVQSAVETTLAQQY
jgi:DNA-binding SARP family transcriptional activator